MSEADYAIEQFAGREQVKQWQYVALAYWCDDAWPICAGNDDETVTAAAERYLEQYPNKFNELGMHINGTGAEGYWIFRIPFYRAASGNGKKDMIAALSAMVLFGGFVYMTGIRFLDIEKRVTELEKQLSDMNDKT